MPGDLTVVFRDLVKAATEAFGAFSKNAVKFYADTATKLSQVASGWLGADGWVTQLYQSVTGKQPRWGVLRLARDPVDVATGDVVLNQADVRLEGKLPLVVARAHRSGSRLGRWLGRSWVSTLDQRLVVTSDGVLVVADDGAVLGYPLPGADGEVVWPEAGPRWPLARAGDGYTVTDLQAGVVRRFEPHPAYEPADGGYAELPLARVSSRAGHQVVFDYEQDGTPVSVTHDGGYQIIVTATRGRVTGLALAGAGADGTDVPLVAYGYDADGNLAEVVNSSGLPMRYSYDETGRLTRWTDRNGWWYQYRYDKDGQCVSTAGPDGMFSATFSYDPSQRVTICTDTAGQATTYQMTDGYRVAAETDPLGATTTSDYSTWGQLVSRADPLGRVTRWAHDEAGNVIGCTRPDGSQMTAVYNQLNLPVLITGPDGSSWRHDYDDRGNLTTRTSAEGAITWYAYDQRGNLTSITDPLGARTLLSCNPAGLVVSVTDPADQVTAYQRDGFGRITAVTAPGGQLTRLSWTTEGLLTARVFADGTAEYFTYDGEGNLTTHTSAGGQVYRYEYGFMDQLSACTAPDGTRTELGYDQEMRLTTLTHAGLRWTYDYDPAGRLAAETDYNGATTRYTYDQAGQLTSQVNAAGQQLSCSYDQLGNLIQLDADGMMTTFGYDLSGRLTRAHNPGALIELAYDPAGRLIAETCNGATVRSSYDLAGRRIQRLTPAGNQTTWTFNTGGRPATMTTGGHQLQFGYNLSGQQIRRLLPGAATLTQDWNPTGQLTTQLLTGPPDPTIPAPPASAVRSRLGAPSPDARSGPGPVLARRAYTYRDDGLLTGIDDLLAGSRQLALNTAGQITAITGGSWAETYAYDQAGNITTATWPPTAGPATPDSRPAASGLRQYSGTLISHAGDIRYEHDRAGRVIIRQHVRPSREPDIWRFQWDAHSRLTTVTTPDGTCWHYTYDPFGRRIAKQSETPGGRTTSHTSYTWDRRTLAEQTATTTGPDDSADGQITAWDYQPGTFTPLTQTKGKQLYAIITDRTGTPTELVTPDGRLAGHASHTLWGATDHTGATTPLRYPGQYADDETGLHYNHHRYYDPVTGRYLTPDPLGLTPAPNPHTYVPNPYATVDPLGLRPGRDDGQTVLSGHGAIWIPDPLITVPEGTEVAVYAEHGYPLKTSVANKIESGLPEPPTPYQVYPAGSQMPNYWLFPNGPGDKVASYPVEVTEPTQLSDLLKPNMGTVHWAACQVVRDRGPYVLVY